MQERPLGRLADLLRTLPNAARLPTSLAEVHVADNFLTPLECRTLAAVIRGRLEPSMLTSQNEPDRAFRTSRTCYLTSADDPLVPDVDGRICQYLGIHPSYGEPLQGQHYEVGQQFKPHTDYFSPDELLRVGPQGQRTWTAMIYLNEVAQGGETRFDRLQTTFTPEIGRAVLWRNLRSDGQPNPDTLHHGQPVVEGSKTIITKWFRERGDGPMRVRDAHDDIPVLTRAGFASVPAPPGLREQLVRAYAVAATDAPGDVRLPAALEAATGRALQPIVDAWAAAPLTPTSVAIRRFVHGEAPGVRRDHPGRAVVTALLALDAHAVWPFQIADHFCRVHRLTPTADDLLVYEGGRLPHGRPMPLESAAYAELCVQYALGSTVSK